MLVQLRRHVDRATAIGLMGSGMILVGSLVVGWLGPGSPLRQWTLFAALRSDDLTVHVGTFLVILGGITLITAWILLGWSIRSRPDNAVARVLTAAITWALPLLVTVPLFTRDLFAYVGQGRLMLHGLNPYSQGMAAIPGWFNLGVDPLWVNSKTPYGPLFVWIEQLVVGAFGRSPETSIAVFRAIAVVGVVAIVYYGYRLAKLRGLDPAQTLWFLAASPLILFNLVVGAHNDALMLGFIVAALYYGSTKRPIPAILLITAAIAVKPIALLALPVIGLLWAGSDQTWRTRIKYWLYTSALSVGLLVGAGLALSVGFGWISALATPGAVTHWYAPVNIIAVGIGGAFATFGLDGELPQLLIKGAALAATGLLLVWLMTTRRPIDPVLRLAFAFAVTVGLSVVIHPWYALWAILLFVLAGVRKGAQTHALVVASIFFSFVSLGEHLDLPENLAGEGVMSAIRAIVIIAGGFAVMGVYASEFGLTPRRVATYVLNHLRGVPVDDSYYEPGRHPRRDAVRNSDRDDMADASG